MHSPLIEFSHAAHTNDREARPTLLVIDDDPKIAKGLERSLRSHCQLIGAATGSAGREIARTRRGIDLIVLDLTMPGYDAVELLRDLRRDGVFTPVVLISGRSAAMLAVVRDLAGALGFPVLDAIEKPFHCAKLLEIVEELTPSGQLDLCA